MPLVVASLCCHTRTRLPAASATPSIVCSPASVRVPVVDARGTGAVTATSAKMLLPGMKTPDGTVNRTASYLVRCAVAMLGKRGFQREAVERADAVLQPTIRPANILER